MIRTEKRKSFVPTLVKTDPFFFIITLVTNKVQVKYNEITLILNITKPFYDLFQFSFQTVSSFRYITSREEYQPHVAIYISAFQRPYVVGYSSNKRASILAWAQGQFNQCPDSIMANCRTRVKEKGKHKKAVVNTWLGDNYFLSWHKELHLSAYCCTWYFRR